MAASVPGSAPGQPPASEGKLVVAYNIDTAAVMAVIRDTEEELSSLASLSTDLQGGVEAVTASLVSSPVGRAFTRYADETLFHDLGSAMAASGLAVQSVKAAVAEYAAADQEMRARAEAAAAAVPAAGSGTPGTTLPGLLPGAVPAAPPRVEPDQAQPVPPASPALPVPPSATAPGLIPALPLPLPWPRPLPPPPPGKEPEPERGGVVPLPGPPPWKPIWPRKPILVLPNPLLRLPHWRMRPPWWMNPPGWMCPPGRRRPPWWMGPPGWMRPPWFPGLPRWPHGPGAGSFPWLWGFWPTPGCPGPHLLPDRGFLPPPDCYYPLVPYEIPLLIKDRPVAQMLSGEQTLSADALLVAGSRKWGLT